MRVLLDTNILISFLLVPRESSVITGVVEQGILGKFTLLLPQDLLEELINKIYIKKYLQERITQNQMREFVSILKNAGEIIPRITVKFPEITRDRKDDYLLAYAVVGVADYLVTGDRDLLDIGQYKRLKILKPAEFAKIIG